MHYESLRDVQPGAVLGRSMFDGKGDLLLSVGYTLDTDMIRLMEEHGYEGVYVMDEFSSEIKLDTVVSDVVRQKANKQVASFMSEVRQASVELQGKTFDVNEIRKSGVFKGAVNVGAMKGMVTDIIDDIMNNETVVFASQQLRSKRSKDYDHAIDVTLLSLILGKKLGWALGDLRALGVAAMAHDIGKMALGAIAERPTYELNADQRLLLREHPVLSKVIVEQNGSNTFKEQITVLQHHEEADGSGYPQRLKSGVFAMIEDEDQARAAMAEQGTGRTDPWVGGIHRYAQILSVANHYDNLLTGDYDGIHYAPAEALEMLVTGQAGTFNPLVLRALFDTIQTYPAGATVRILDNKSKRFIKCQGVIAVSNPAFPNRPRMVITTQPDGRPRTPPVTVDFAQEDDMQLELVA